MSVTYGSYRCRECGSEFYAGGAPIHEETCPLYPLDWPRQFPSGQREHVFGPYVGCDYVPPPKPHTLYTYGYSGGGRIEDLQAYARAGALILDIRFSPHSRNPQWGRSALLRALWHSYQLDQSLGNVNYRSGGPIQLKAPKVGIPLLLAVLQQRPVVLLCACRDWETCHRRVVAELAQEQAPDLAVMHLAPGDPLRVSIHLDEAFPDLSPSFEEWDVRRYWEWEERVARPALEAAGWTVGQFRTLDGDSFGPLTRGVTCAKDGQRVQFWYG